MIDKDTRSAKTFYRLVRDFSERVKAWEPQIVHMITPDERRDPTLISQRVYGRRDEFLAVMAAAGVDTIDQPLAQKQIRLPTESKLSDIKRLSGFESMHKNRSDFAPTWTK